MAVDEDMLLFARRHAINLMSLSSFEYHSVPVQGIKSAIAVDFDPVEKQIYWTDNEQQFISRSYLDGSGNISYRGPIKGVRGFTPSCVPYTLRPEASGCMEYN